MEIRRAALADIPGVCACCVAAFKDYIPLIGQTPGPMLEDYCQARKEHFLFVAAQGETILGYLPHQGWRWGGHVDGCFGRLAQGDRRGEKAHGLLRGLPPCPG